MTEPAASRPSHDDLEAEVDDLLQQVTQPPTGEADPAPTSSEADDFAEFADIADYLDDIESESDGDADKGEEDNSAGTDEADSAEPADQPESPAPDIDSIADLDVALAGEADPYGFDTEPDGPGASADEQLFDEFLEQSVQDAIRAEAEPDVANDPPPAEPAEPEPVESPIDRFAAEITDEPAPPPRPEPESVEPPPPASITSEEKSLETPATETTVVEDRGPGIVQQIRERSGELARALLPRVARPCRLLLARATVALERLPTSTHQTIKWCAMVTLLNAAALWIFLAMRGSPEPPPPEDPVGVIATEDSTDSAGLD